MIRKIITVLVVLVCSAAIYVGVTNDLEQRAEAEEKILYTVHVMRNTEYGYVPVHDFEMSKRSLEAHVKLCWFTAQRYDNGNLLIGFEEGENTWFIMLRGNDPEIGQLKRIVKDYGLKCEIP